MGSLARSRKNTIEPYTNPVEFFTPPFKLFLFCARSFLTAF